MRESTRHGSGACVSGSARQETHEWSRRPCVHEKSAHLILSRASEALLMSSLRKISLLEYCEQRRGKISMSGGRTQRPAS